MEGGREGGWIYYWLSSLSPDPSAVEVCVVKRFTPDVPQEHENFSLLRELAAGRGRRGGTGTSPHLTHPEDNIGERGGVLMIGGMVRVNIHPQNTLSKGYNVFGS